LPVADGKYESVALPLDHSFINNAPIPAWILAKAVIKIYLFVVIYPSAFKDKDRYTGGTRFQRQCSQSRKTTPIRFMPAGSWPWPHTMRPTRDRRRDFLQSMDDQNRERSRAIKILLPTKLLNRSTGRENINP